MAELRSKYYRVSVKALVLNEAKNAFLVAMKHNGIWDLPGGGLEWGEKPHDGLRREIKEELQVPVVAVAERPTYFFGGYPMVPEEDIWIAIVVYETILAHLNFIPSDECQEIRFVSAVDLHGLDGVPSPVRDLASQFRPEHHRDTFIG